MSFEILSSENLRQLELLQLRSQKRFLGSRQGGNASLKRGHGIEFADYRRYELGDDPRHIDWGVYGRTDRVYVKQFQEEQDLTVYCVLDATSSLHSPVGDRKFYAASQVALGMLYVSLACHNRVLLTVPGHKHFGPFSGMSRVHQMGKFLSEVPELSPEKYAAGFTKFLFSVDFPGICILISDFLAPLSVIHAQLEALYVRNLDVLGVRILGPHDRDPFYEQDQALFVDSETGDEIPLQGDEATRKEYSFYFERHSRGLQDLFTKYQMRFVEFMSSDPIMPFFSEDIANTGFLRR